MEKCILLVINYEKKMVTRRRSHQSEIVACSPSHTKLIFKKDYSF